MNLLKFSGLLRSGLSIEQSLTVIGGIPNNQNVRYLIEIAIETGSAAAKELEAIAEQLFELDKSRERIEILQAAPRASARLIIWFPVVVLAVVQLSGFGLIETILKQPLLMLSVGFGFGLLILAKFLSDKLVSSAMPESSPTGLFLLALAMNLSAGGELERARELATVTFQRVYLKKPENQEILAFQEVADLIDKNGNPAGELLRRQADILQRAEQLEMSQRIEKLSVRLLLPLGLLVLPAFILIALIPLGFSMLGS